MYKHVHLQGNFSQNDLFHMTVHLSSYLNIYSDKFWMYSNKYIYMYSFGERGRKSTGKWSLMLQSAVSNYVEIVLS